MIFWGKVVLLLLCLNTVYLLSRMTMETHLHKKLFVFNNFSDQVFLLNDQKLSDRIISFIQKRRKPFFDGVAHTANEMLNFLK